VLDNILHDCHDILLVVIASDDVSESDSDDGGNLTDPSHRIRVLEEKLATARKDLIDYRAFVNQQLKSPTLSSIDADPGPSNVNSTTKDDDSHYFDSYDAHGMSSLHASLDDLTEYCIDIHAIMIQDQVRTSTYASFILRNPSIFNDAVVLDVGCGTGILSLFAARGGAKRVIAVDASGIAEKARQIVKENGLDDIITYVDIRSCTTSKRNRQHLVSCAAKSRTLRFLTGSHKWTLLFRNGWGMLCCMNRCLTPYCVLGIDSFDQGESWHRVNAG
jgi:protein arginine N-methyltransferase 3